MLGVPTSGSGFSLNSFVSNHDTKDFIPWLQSLTQHGDVQQQLCCKLIKSDTKLSSRLVYTERRRSAVEGLLTDNQQPI